MTNVLRILHSGQLTSRSTLLNHDLPFDDLGRERILTQREQKATPTGKPLASYVPLLFCKRSCMLYMLEGVKLQLDEFKHCPHPVVLEFEPVVLELPGVLVSDQWAGNPRALLDFYPNGLKLVDFSSVNNPLAYRQSETKDRKHAEILIPDALDLCHLRTLIVRSQAEYLQLGTLLSRSKIKFDKKRIRISPKYFFLHRSYVQECAYDFKSKNVRLFVRNAYEKAIEAWSESGLRFPVKHLYSEDCIDIWQIDGVSAVEIITIGVGEAILAEISLVELEDESM